MPRRLLAIPKHERRAVVRLFAYCALIAASYTATRTSADSLFLSRIGNQDLAAIFVVSGIATAFIASLWILITRKLSLETSLRLSGISFSAISLTAWWLLPEFHHAWWLMGAIYLLAEIKGCLNAINIITAMNEILGGHSSRYAWAAIGLGVPIAGIIVGALIGIEASLIDIRSWLLVAAVLDFVAVIPSLPLQSFRVPDYTKPEQPILEWDRTRSSKQGKSYACSRQFGFWIAILISAKVIVLTIITFEWKVTVNDYFGGNEQALARYFGVFYACVSGATLLIQAFLTGPLLTKRGLSIPILVMPGAFLLLNVLYLTGTGILFLFVVTTFAKSMEIWRRSVHDTTLSLLYTRIERKKRRRAIALNSAVVKPVSEVSASLFLIAGPSLLYKTLTIVATLIWIGSTIALLRLLKRSRRIQSDTVATHSAARSP